MLTAMALYCHMKSICLPCCYLLLITSSGTCSHLFVSYATSCRIFVSYYLFLQYYLMVLVQEGHVLAAGKIVACSCH
jgi:hypothetical protein